MLRSSIEKVLAGKDLSRQEAQEAFNAIMDGECSEVQMAAFLTGLRMKGESRDEIVAAATAMRQRLVHVPIDTARYRVLDTCGTGGDGTNTFNISTTVALLLCAHGDIKVAKHGNVSISSRSGSADLMRCLGVDIAAPAHRIAKSLESCNLGFIFAANHHPAMKYAAPVRRGLGIRTIFNILGPLTNPANAPYQLMGVFDPQMLTVLAEVLLELGSRKVILVSGNDGMDEVTLCADTQVVIGTEQGIRRVEFNPEALGMAKVVPDELRGDTPEVNREITLGILKGSVAGARRDIVILNAAFALYAAEVTDSIADGVHVSRELIDSGAAWDACQRFIDFNRQQEQV
ncbi:anthranilate phosphoribosyltransferase [Desulfurispira natronophila]|uniref:Anthranilate phosphoribosyltransferase n=1 Tax=Desulfurispira natronophila TaxID=682562 RepID=A0A7W7Y4U9_9BACT|nr:anthranilate phosphoribosyltransferase [Desulfurispira natronophila]MBB5022121.1 anthranilate phosphoribosyltransferase [Desulfurispira natronophila]